MAKASIQAIVDALEMQLDEWLAFLDRDTGEVHHVQLSTLSFIEEGGDPEEADVEDDEEAKLALAIVEHRDRFLRLPTKFDIHEWEIMREFSESVGPQQFSNDLLNAIRGEGAFRYFKDTLYRYRREKEWFAFREEALRDIAIEWCEDNGIEYVEDRRRASGQNLLD
jgi:Uncharacterised protein family (UPF0158)